MNPIDRTPEPGRDWRQILREQGRTLTWLAQETGKTYPQVTSYAQGTAKVPADWLERVHQLLGVSSR